jgi:SsrA-binding protein
MSKMMAQVNREGMTIVPLGIFFNKRGIAKVELGIAKGKHKSDKRETIKKREFERDRDRALRDRG